MRTLGLALLGCLVALPSLAAAAPPPIRLDVDARDAGRGLFHATEVVPVTAGAFTLAYPKWIPGEHGPTGPIGDLAAITISAGGQRLAWTRDPVDMYQLHVDVPAGTTELALGFDLLGATQSAGFSSGASSTTELAVVSWNQVVLYPAGSPSDDVTVAATLRLPASWQLGTALPIAKQTGDTTTFAPVTLTTLVDSPVLAGAHTRLIPLSKSPAVRLFAAADGDAALELPDELIAHYQALVAEAIALFGARHFDSYTFLVTLSDDVAHFGLEHHQSSDDRMKESSWIDEDGRRVTATLLSHEFVHSWNGKYRRPRGLATGGFDAPMQGKLLWVYEGLTEYFGWVLAARSGLSSAADARDALAFVAERLDLEAGRNWRPLEDTTDAAQVLYESPGAWSSRRRGVDFYPEGLLLWLEVDTIIRRESKGARSIDDFAHAFYGGKDSSPAVVPYDLDDVIAALEKVQHHAWKQFFADRVSAVTAHPPLAGISDGGWKLTWTTELPALQKASDSVFEGTTAWWSLGIDLDKEGEIEDVRAGSPADDAGLVPGAKLIAIDTRGWNPERLRTAIAGTATAKKLDLLIQTDDFYRTATLTYAGGDRFPTLARDPAHADLLSKIMAPHRKH